MSHANSQESMLSIGSALDEDTVTPALDEHAIGHTEENGQPQALTNGDAQEEK